MENNKFIVRHGSERVRRKDGVKSWVDAGLAEGWLVKFSCKYQGADMTFIVCSRDFYFLTVILVTPSTF
jgi:hypothetical protein